MAHSLGLMPNEIRNPCRTFVACLVFHSLNRASRGAHGARAERTVSPKGSVL